MECEFFLSYTLLIYIKDKKRGIKKTCNVCMSKKSDRRDSNPRPSAWEADALPTEPLSHLNPVQNYSFYFIFPKKYTFFTKFNLYLFVDVPKSNYLCT